jgi:hypothetical protein
MNHGAVKLSVLALSLVLVFSCRAGREQEQKSPGMNPGPNAAAESPPKSAGLDTWYKFESERRSVEKEAAEKYLSLLKAANSLKGPKFESGVSQYQEDTAVRLKALRDKYGVSYQELDRQLNDPAGKTSREQFLAGRPQLKKALDELEAAQKELDQQIADELDRLQKKETPAGQKPLIPGSGK